ncbi:MAG: TerB family tellurite resistance protein, partial [Candidatus Cloacimonetes bacterium]|nr:TerB family tellurite resistance protein [Candidatus Cloacimonadota bacterium]MBL7086689.1 TerB family tellurite resistance protein [Candidatus Cloacimonadota bacterium]
RKIQIATCALLLELANADSDFADVERESIISILKNNFQFSDEETDALIKETENELKESIDLWQFTNLINQNFSVDEKEKILENAWKIIYADKRLDQYEDYLIHKIANLLRLNHKQLIKTKLKVRENEKRD